MTEQVQPQGASTTCTQSREIWEAIATKLHVKETTGVVIHRAKVTVTFDFEGIVRTT